MCSVAATGSTAGSCEAQKALNTSNLSRNNLLVVVPASAASGAFTSEMVTALPAPLRPLAAGAAASSSVAPWKLVVCTFRSAADSSSTPHLVQGSFGSTFLMVEPAGSDRRVRFAAGLLSTFLKSFWSGL